ncbi:hypothetical protein C6A85_08760, partial [Mycobacterium sp. ITM-2017-0098]
TKKADGAVNWLVLADANVDAFVDEDEETFDDEPGKGSDPTTRIDFARKMHGATATTRAELEDGTTGVGVNFMAPQKDSRT